MADSRMKKLLPLLYENVIYQNVTIAVPIDARNSRFGLPNFGEIHKVTTKQALQVRKQEANVQQTKEQIMSVDVGSTSVLELKKKIYEDKIVRF